jgi:hypothetical protein
VFGTVSDACMDTTIQAVVVAIVVGVVYLSIVQSMAGACCILYADAVRVYHRGFVICCTGFCVYTSVVSMAGTVCMRVFCVRVCLCVTWMICVCVYVCMRVCM